MNRLETKCLIASASAHGLLLLLLMIAPLLWAPQHHEVVLPIITLVSTRLVDGPGSGGSPNARPIAAPPSPPIQAPPEPAAPRPLLAPPKQDANVAQDEPEVAPKPRSRRSAEPTVSEKKIDQSKADDSDDVKVGKRKIHPDFTREASKSKPAGNARESRAQSQARNARADIAERLSQALSAIGEGVPSGTSFDLPGPGGGGEISANWKSAVLGVYYNAWIVAPEDKDEMASIKVKVIIHRNGKVLSFELVKPSGNLTLDNSVERLKNIREVPPFPDGANELERSLILNFKPTLKKEFE